MSKLKYETVGSVLTVTNPDTDESFSYDTDGLRQFPKVLDKLIVHTVKKLLQERTSDAKTNEDRFDGMLEVVESFKAGQFKATPKSRRKLPDWLKGKTREVQAIAALKAASLDAVYASLEKLGKDAAEKVFASDAVKAKMAESAEELDFDDLMDDESE